MGLRRQKPLFVHVGSTKGLKTKETGRIPIAVVKGVGLDFGGSQVRNGAWVA